MPSCKVYSDESQIQIRKVDKIEKKKFLHWVRVSCIVRYLDSSSSVG